MRRILLVIVWAGAHAASARAQAPATGPLALLLPSSTRAAAMGDVAVASRDESALFYNPALVTAAPGAGGSFVRYGSNGTLGTLAGAVAVNWLTLGWGVQVVEFTARSDASYPFTPADVTRRGSRDALSLVAGAGANFLIKGFRAGVGVKYAEDRVGASVAEPTSPAVLKGFILGDLGVSHRLFSGTAAAAVQNIGDDSRLGLPIQTTLGWTRPKQAGPFDLAVAAQLLERGHWIGGGGGVEAAYGWIEGWSVAVRAGARRTESVAQHPVSVGGALNADHLALDYALEFFDGRRYAHHVSLRWR